MGRLGAKGAVATLDGSLGRQLLKESWAVLHLMPLIAPGGRRLMACVR